MTSKKAIYIGMDSNQEHTTIRIALVEDDTTVREGLKQLICGTSGVDCVGFYANAEEALKEIPEKKPDVVLMDIHLPGMSGIECIRQLKKQNFTSPIIMLTVYVFTKMMNKFLNPWRQGRAVIYLKKHRRLNFWKQFTTSFTVVRPCQARLPVG